MHFELRGIVPPSLDQTKGNPPFFLYSRQDLSQESTSARVSGAACSIK